MLISTSKQLELKLHWFAGVRLLMHAAHRLIREDGQYACITACAAGGQVCTTWHYLLSWGNTSISLEKYFLLISFSSDLHHCTKQEGDNFLFQSILCFHALLQNLYFFTSASYFHSLIVVSNFFHFTFIDLCPTSPLC